MFQIITTLLLSTIFHFSFGKHVDFHLRPYYYFTNNDKPILPNDPLLLLQLNDNSKSLLSRED